MLIDELKSESKQKVHDLELAKLKTGFLVDYDLKTWEVTAVCRYDYSQGYATDEWELTSGREKRYLERAEDDEISWGFSQKIPIGAIDGDVRKQIIDQGDPPDQITHKGTTYYLDESGVGRMRRQGQAEKEFAFWEFIDEADDKFLTIEQWDETDFEAAAGFYVEEYQFSNILPGTNL